MYSSLLNDKFFTRTSIQTIIHTFLSQMHCNIKKDPSRSLKHQGRNNLKFGTRGDKMVKDNQGLSMKMHA